MKRSTTALGYRPVLSLIACVALTVASATWVPSAGADPDPAAPPVAAAPAAPPEDPGTNVPAAPQDAIGTPGEEVVSERTEFSRTLVAADGVTRVAEIYGEPINYLDPSGTYQAIDTTLEPVDGGWAPAAGGSVTLPGTSDGALTLDSPAGEVSMRLIGAAPAPLEVGDGSAQRGGEQSPDAESSATASDALPGVDVTWTAQSAGVKELITLAATDSARDIRFSLTVPDGLTPTLQDDGSIRYLDADGVAVLVTPAAFMDDATGAHSDDVPYSLAQAGDGTWTLAVAPDAAWLDDPARQYPVVIDPTTTVVSAAPALGGCTIKSTGGKCLTVGNLLDEVGTTAYTPQVERLIFRTALAGVVPTGSVVTNATLKLAVTDDDGAAIPLLLQVAPLARAWDPAASANQASWTQATSSVAWTTPGGDFTAPTGEVTLPASSAGSIYNVDLTAVVNSWQNLSSTNNGFILKSAIEGTVRSAEIGDLGTGAGRTNMTITYAPQLGSYSGSQRFDVPLTDRSGLGVNLGTGNAVLAADDLAAVSRTWNSQSTGLTAVPQIAAGWSLNVGNDTRATADALGHITYIAPDGGVYLFGKKLGLDQWISPPGLTAAAYKDPSTSIITIRFERSGATLTFAANGQMTSATDRNGNPAAFAYSGTSSTGGWPLIASTTDAAGRVTTIGNNGAIVTGATDTASRSVAYTVTAGKLASVLDANAKTTTYAYDGSGRIDRITTAAGRVVRLGYDASNRVTSIIRVTNPAGAGGLGSGPTTTFAYTATTTTVTDANSHATVYAIDQAGRVVSATDALGHKQSAAWGPDNNVTTAVDAMTGGGNTSTFSYDSDFRATGSALPTGAASSIDYTGAAGATKYRPTFSIDPQSKKTTFSYDAVGNLTQAQDTTGGTAGIAKYLTYNPVAPAPMVCGGKPGQVCSSTDGNGHTTSYAYDAQGNMITTTPPAPLAAETYTYDTLGRIATHTDGKAQITRFTYDAIDRPTKVQYGGITTCTPGDITAGLCITYGYDDDGNRTSRLDATGTTAYGYDQLSRQTTKTMPGAVVVTTTYDAVGNLASIIEPSGTTTYTYFNDNTLKSLAEPTGSCTGTISLCTTFTYDANHRRLTTTYPNATVQTSTYDNSGRATRIRGVNGSTVISDLSYSYTASGGGVTDRTLLQSRTTTAGITAGVVTSYGYDNLSRLLSATDTLSGATNASWAYTYDNAGNRLSQTVSGTNPGTASATFGYNSADQLTTLNGSATGWSYDANGNTTSMINTIGLSATRVFGYDAADRNTSTAVGSATDTYTYAGGSNNERTGTTTGGVTTSFLNSLTGVTSSGGAGGATVVREPNGNPVAVKAGAVKGYVLTDNLGSVVALSNSGTPASHARYSYDPYGNLRTTSQTDATIGALLTANPVRYAGGWYDASTGLYKLGYRYYSPQYGRFTQPDPSGQESNAYAYTAGSPINRTDPTGLTWADCISAIAQAGAAAVSAGGASTLPGGGFAIAVPLAVTAAGLGHDAQVTCEGYIDLGISINFYPTADASGLVAEVYGDFPIGGGARSATAYYGGPVGGGIGG